MPSPANPGEDRAWELLAAMNAAEVCRQANVSYDHASRSYRVRSFGMDFDVSPDGRSISSTARGSDVLLGRLGYFFRLSVLWYLVSAKEISGTGRFVKIESIRGGDAFAKGSHVLPLEPLALKYGKDREGFAKKAVGLGGEFVKQADVAFRLLPLPRVPVVLALWLEDDEFPARADLLFDSTCELQVPPDIVWSVALVSVLMMMEDVTPRA